MVFHILDQVKTNKNLSEVEKFTDSERLQSLASDFISPRIEINSEEGADKTACDFTKNIDDEHSGRTSIVT
jgi:hypothetical protein